MTKADTQAYDRVESLGGALVHHGPANDRVYLMKCSFTEPRKDLVLLDELARTHNYGKIFAKVPAPWAKEFLADGYREEGRIPSYYGSDDCLFLCRYRDATRAVMSEADRILADEVLALARSKAPAFTASGAPEAAGAGAPTAGPASGAGPGSGAGAGAGPEGAVPAEYSLRALGVEDAPLLAALYREVFASYPFPVHDSAYIRETMDADVAYFGAFRDGRLVAASSAEMDPATSSAEMTDFATLPGETGKGLAGALLAAMEQDVPRQGISTLYTIARAFSHGMNITFARAGYEYGGTLVNNTDIFGRIESMNLWHKKAKAL